MMSSKAAVALVMLAVLAGTVSADVMCFVGTSYTNGNQEVRDTKPATCSGQFCLKTYQKNFNYNNYQTNSYGCSGDVCARGGCHENKAGFGTCCCRGAYCNSGYDLSKTAVSSMVLTVVSAIYLCI